MPRIPFPDHSKQPERIRRQVEGGINAGRIFSLASEPVWDGFWNFSLAILWNSKLDAQLRELAILRVGHLSGCAYEVYQHEPFARKVGLPDDVIKAIKGGLPNTIFTEPQAAIIAFTDDIVKNVRASDLTLSRVRAIMEDRCLMDLMMVIGWYMMACRVFMTTDLDMDVKPISFPDNPPAVAAGN